jgi:hypothetical protein
MLFCQQFIGLRQFNFNNIQLPLSELKGKTYVFDPLRKKRFLLTPEEEVRQKLLWYLTQIKGVPTALIAVERGLKINAMQKRFDIVVYQPSGLPFLAIECKAPSVKLTQNTLNQLAVYNLHLKAGYLMVSNGLDHIIAAIDFETRAISFLPELPF